MEGSSAIETTRTSDQAPTTPGVVVKLVDCLILSDLPIDHHLLAKVQEGYIEVEDQLEEYQMNLITVVGVEPVTQGERISSMWSNNVLKEFINKVELNLHRKD